MKKFLIPETGRFYKANLHAHTCQSDGSATPEEVKQVFMELGYDIVAYTDHDIMLDRSHLCDDKFLALNGYEMEINGKGTPDWANMETCHINFIAIEPDNLKQACWHRSEYLYAHAVEYRDQIQFYEDEPDYERFYTGECISDMFAQGRKHGFFTTYNHPTGSLESYPQYMSYNNMHAMEMYNGHEYNPRVYDDMLRGGKMIYCVGGDDSHNRPTLMSGSGLSWTMIKADKLDYRTVTQALLDGNFYASQGPDIHSLWMEDDMMNVDCSDAVDIIFTASNRRAKHFCATKGEVINHAEYKVFPDSKYVRVTIVDKAGKTASSNAYPIEKLLG